MCELSNVGLKRQCLPLYLKPQEQRCQLFSSLITLQENVLINHPQHLAADLGGGNLKP